LRSEVILHADWQQASATLASLSDSTELGPRV
jgi:hypothetical protein